MSVSEKKGSSEATNISSPIILRGSEEGRRKLQEALTRRAVRLVGEAKTMHLHDYVLVSNLGEESAVVDPATYIPLNIYSMRSSVRESLSERFQHDEPRLSDFRILAFSLQDKIGALDQEVAKNSILLQDLRQSLEIQFSRQSSPPLGGSVGYLPEARIEHASGDSEKVKEQAFQQVITDITAFHRKEVWIVIGMFFAFVIGMLVLSAL